MKLKHFLSPINFFLKQPSLESSWRRTYSALRHNIYFPTGVKNILEYTLVRTLRTSDFEEMQRLKKILEQRFMVFTIEVTNICNANCQFCAYKHHKRSKRIISNESFRYAIRQFARSGGGVLNLTPIVGDSLIDQGLVAKIKFAKKWKEIKYLFLFTNLIGLRNFNLTEFLLSGLDEINVSTCIGSEEMYKETYGVDKYITVMQNLESLLTENRRLGDQVKIEIHIRGKKLHKRIMSSSDYRRIVNLYGRSISHFDDKYDNWAGLIREDDLPEGHTFTRIKDMSEPCSELYNGMIVFMNGDVGICWRRDLEAKLVIGNIYESSLNDIWKGKSLHMIREDWLRGSIPLICRKCYCYTPLSYFLVGNRNKISSLRVHANSEGNIKSIWRRFRCLY